MHPDYYAVPIERTGTLSPADAVEGSRREPHHKHRRDAIRQHLHVVACVFNPVRYQSRWDLYEDFARRVSDAGARLTTIEATFGERQSAVDATRYGQHVTVAVDHLQEIWIKENLLNLALRHLPPDWKYVAFVDADTNFARPDWVDATIHALQHYHVAQMFTEAMDLGPTHNILMSHKGFAWCHRHQPQTKRDGDGYYCHKGAGGFDNYWHPGFAWAWRRESLNMVGGLMEHGILGACDAHMARALIGRGAEETHPDISAGYRRAIASWQRRAVEHIKGNLGYVEGTILHAWHGKKRDRQYWDRWKILTKHGFDPETDLKRDINGVIRLTDTKPGLRDDIRAYLRRRNEDSIDE